MGRKWFDKVLFVVVAALLAVFTWYVGKGSPTTMYYNFGFLALMLVLCIFGMAFGFGKMGRLERAFSRATDEIDQTFRQQPEPGRRRQLSKELFAQKDLDARYANFTAFIKGSQSGIGDIEDYINEGEVDSIIRKRLIDLIPDVLTSLGILGTFIGLVVGLKDFEPTNYETMTASVSSLVEGIKVAFLTSIYGLSLSLVFGYGSKVAYGALADRLQSFLDAFHHFVIPSAEAETQNLMVNYQGEQAEAMAQMSQQFSEHLAKSFEQVITPSFRKMNESMDILTETLASGQEKMMQGLLDDFLSKMRASFQLQFNDFNQALNDLTSAQQAVADNTKTVYRDMARDLRETFHNEDDGVQAAVKEMGRLQQAYTKSAQEAIERNEKYAASVNEQYRQVVSYMQDAEQNSAKFWVACNQAMQKYVSAAGAGLEGFAEASKHNSELYGKNEQLVESYQASLKEFAQCQQAMEKTMEEVQKLLYTIVTSPDETHRTGIRNLAVNNSNRDLIMGLQRTIEEQGQRQEALLSDLLACMKELRPSKRGKGLFR